MEITYQINEPPATEEIIDLYISAGLNRPVNDPTRIRQMYDNSNLIVTARSHGQLVGCARSLTDYCYCCYLSDLAVRKELQKAGIGKRLMEITKEKIGAGSMLLLLSAPGAMEYYPKTGFTKTENGFIINRSQ